MKLKIAFSDFWATFVPEKFWLYQQIAKQYDCNIVGAEETPDILFYSCFGNDHLVSDAKLRIYFTGENDVPDFNLCDYAISFHHLDFGSRHLRLPLYAVYPSFDVLRKGERGEASFDRKFCSFVVSNNFCADSKREEFFHKLSEYKRVDSGGRYLNNIGGSVDDKLKFLREYKFNIAFENSAVDGYTTEKLVDALAAGTLPIYWGNPRVNLDFPKDCFIDVADFKTVSEAIEYVIKVDNDRELYETYFHTTPHIDNPFLEWEKMFMDFFDGIISYGKPRIPEYGIWRIKREELMLSRRIGRINMVTKNVEFFERAATLKNKIFGLKDSLRHSGKK